MVDRLMLQGRFNAKFRRYSVVGLSMSAISGVITYFVVKEREKKMTAFMHNVTAETQVNLNERIKKLAFPEGAAWNSCVPLDNSDGSFDEFLRKADDSTNLLFLEQLVLSEFDPEIGDVMINMFLGGLRDSFNGSRSDRIARRKQLNDVRAKLAENMKEGKYQSDSVQNKMLVELRRQRESGAQSESNPLPLGNAYLLKVAGDDE